MSNSCHFSKSLVAQIYKIKDPSKFLYFRNRLFHVITCGVLVAAMIIDKSDKPVFFCIEGECWYDEPGFKAFTTINYKVLSILVRYVLAPLYFDFLKVIFWFYENWINF